MANYDVTLSQALLPALLSGKEGLAKVLESALNQVIEAQMTEHIGAERYERTGERVDGRYRNGYRERQLFTRVGPVTLRVPQTRDGSFSTEIFERYQRSERAFVLGLMEMYVKAAERADALRTQAYQRRQSVGDDVEAMVLGSLPVTNFRNQQAAIV